MNQVTRLKKLSKTVVRQFTRKKLVRSMKNKVLRMGIISQKHRTLTSLKGIPKESNFYHSV